MNPTCPMCRCATEPRYYAGEHRFYRCRECSLSFVSPQPSTEYLREFYSTFHKTLDAGGGYEMHEVRIAQDFPAKLRRLAELQPNRSARILDVGCGKGYFVKACIDAGYDAEGIDLSDTAVRHATEVLGVRAHCKRLEDLDGADQYDVVTFWATIEHLQDPVGVLQSIHRILRPGGLLLLDTGVGSDWLDRVLPGVVQWYDPPQHLFVFSTKSMELCLGNAGFTVMNIDACFERSALRRFVRRVRAATYAVGLRALASVSRAASVQNFQITRFPLGNLMSVAARKAV